MDRGSALDGFSVLYDGSGNLDAIVAQRLTLKVNVPHEQVLAFQQEGGGVCKRTPLGRLYEPEFWRRNHLKQRLIEEAQTFYQQVSLQGYLPLLPIYSLEVWGPYTEKVGTPQDWVPEADNPFYGPDKPVATTTWSYRGDEFTFDKGDVYLLVGEFTRKASLGHVEEERGILIV